MQKFWVGAGDVPCLKMSGKNIGKIVVDADNGLVSK